MFRRLIGFAAMVALMAVGAQAHVPMQPVPMQPVPMTLQSLVIVLAGLCLGPVGGLLAALAYLLLALIGLPVLSDGASGLEPFSGATAGYIYAFPVVAGLAGLLGRSRWGDRPVGGISALFGLHLLLLAAGAAWLAVHLPAARALAGGFTPFLPGAAVKSVAAWLIWRGLRRVGTG